MIPVSRTYRFILSLNIDGLQSLGNQERPYHVDRTTSRPLCEVKRCRARLVLRTVGDHVGSPGAVPSFLLIATIMTMATHTISTHACITRTYTCCASTKKKTQHTQQDVRIRYARTYYGSSSSSSTPTSSCPQHRHTWNPL